MRVEGLEKCELKATRQLTHSIASAVVQSRQDHLHTQHGRGWQRLRVGSRRDCRLDAFPDTTRLNFRKHSQKETLPAGKPVAKDAQERSAAGDFPDLLIPSPKPLNPTPGVSPCSRKRYRCLTRSQAVTEVKVLNPVTNPTLRSLHSKPTTHYTSCNVPSRIQPESCPAPHADRQ